MRWQGRPVVVQHGSRAVCDFWLVLRLQDAPRATLIVATTDVHLINEDNGQLVTLSIEPKPSTNSAFLQWLDSEGGQPGEPQSFGIQRSEGPAWLAGGRYLRSRYAVLDVKTLELKPFQA